MRTGAGIIAIFILAGIMIIGSIVMKVSGYNNKQTITTKVTDKERITKQSGDRVESYYLVFTEAGTQMCFCAVMQDGQLFYRKHNEQQ